MAVLQESRAVASLPHLGGSDRLHPGKAQRLLLLFPPKDGLWSSECDNRGFMTGARNYFLTSARRTSSRQGAQTAGYFVQSHKWLGSYNLAPAPLGTRRKC